MIMIFNNIDNKHSLQNGVVSSFELFRNGDIEETDTCEDEKSFFDFSECDDGDELSNARSDFRPIDISNLFHYRMQMSRRFACDSSRFGARGNDDGFENFDFKTIKELSPDGLQMFRSTSPQIYVAGIVLHSTGAHFAANVADNAELWGVWKLTPYALVWGIEHALKLMRVDRDIKKHGLNLYHNPLIVMNTLLRKTYEANQSGEKFNAAKLKEFVEENWINPETGGYYVGIPNGSEYYLYFLGMSGSDILPDEDTLEVFRKMGVRNTPIAKVRELIKLKNGTR